MNESTRSSAEEGERLLSEITARLVDTVSGRAVAGSMRGGAGGPKNWAKRKSELSGSRK